jgi:hypothetical protein
MRSPSAAPPPQQLEEGTPPQTRKIINARGVRTFFLSTDPKCALSTLLHHGYLSIVPVRACSTGAATGTHLPRVCLGARRPVSAQQIPLARLSEPEHLTLLKLMASPIMPDYIDTWLQLCMCCGVDPAAVRAALSTQGRRAWIEGASLSRAAGHSHGGCSGICCQ